MFFPWVSVLTLLRILEGANGESVTQPEDRLTVSQGAPALLKCSYGTSYIPTLWWYEQYPNEAPRLLLGDYEASDEEERRSRRGFSATPDKQGKTFHLKKNSSELRDSAVYYCAMSPYDTGYKVLFGKGTELLVIPNLEKSKASIYRVKSQNGIYSACLITDFSPGNIEVGFSEKSLTEVNASVVQVKNPDSGEMEASYGTVLLVNQENISCIAQQELELYNVTESAEEGDTCKIMELDDNFETDNQLNLLSFTLLGLRIVFVKGVALNLLLTFWLWKS